MDSVITRGPFCHYLFGDSRKGKLMISQQVAPGPRGSILLGSMRDFQRDPLKFLEDATDVYGDIVRFRLGPHQVYLVNDPAYIYELLVTQAKKIRKADLITNILAKWLGNGIMTSDGDFHRRQRRLVQPAFHHQHIATYAGAMVEHALRTLNNWQNMEGYDIKDEMMKLTMDIVSTALFGADVSRGASKLGGAVATLQQISTVEYKAGFMIPEWMPVPRNHRRRAAIKVVNDTILGFIRERRASGEHKDDLLSMLLQAKDEDGGRMMTDEQVRDEAVTLFVAGHETVSNALTWTWYLLSQNPDAELKLHAELDRVLGGRPPTLQDLAELKYTEMVVKEAMRLYPPAWILMSRTPLETVTVGGYQINPGDWIFICPYLMHRSPRYFEEPQRFDPERFTEVREKELPRYAYFPFGGGQRVCIGNSFAMMEMRLILATVAQQYKLILQPGQKIMPEPEITLRPRYGLHMTTNAREPMH